MKRIIFTTVLIFNVIHLTSQNINQQAYWFRLVVKVKLGDKWSWQNEADYRRFINPDRVWQSYSQSHLHYRFHKNWETVLGVGYAAVWQGTLIVPEWRPYEDIQYFQNFPNGWQLAYRGRVEQRFIHKYSKSELTEGFGFRFRPRLRVQLSKTIDAKWSAKLS
jgi:Protein of unknown function (DUF2490)